MDTQMHVSIICNCHKIMFPGDRHANAGTIQYHMDIVSQTIVCSRIHWTRAHAEVLLHTMHSASCSLDEVIISTCTQVGRVFT